MLITAVAVGELGEDPRMTCERASKVVKALRLGNDCVVSWEVFEDGGETSRKERQSFSKSSSPVLES